MAARITGASLDPILTRLNGVDNYHPLDAETFSDWSIEAGDLVTVSRNGVSYKSPVHTSTLTWKGTTPQVRISSTGREARDPVSVAARKKYGRGSSALLNSQQAYKDIITSYNNMTAGLILASSSASLYVLDMYNQMKSGLDLTSSTAALYVDDAYNQMKSGLDLTSSTAALYVDDAYNQMKAGLDLTSSTAALYVDDAYNQMKAGLDLTSSTAALYVDDAYNQMKAGLDLTSSSASLYVDSKYDQMKAGLDLTSSSASLYVDSKYNQMKAGLDLTSSTAALYVEDAYNKMSAGLDVTSSSAALYTESKTTRAAIMTRINADGEGEALIDADKVSITGDTTLAGSLEIDQGYLFVKKSANFQGNITLTTAGSTVHAPQFAVSSGGYLRLIGTQTGEHYDLTAASIQGYIRKAEIDSSTNTLKLWKVTDSDNNPSILFRKAASSLSGSWSSGNFPLTVTDGTNNYTIGIGGSYGDHDVELEIVTNGSVTKDSLVAQTIDVPIKAAQLNNGAASTDRYTKTLAVSVSGLLETKQATSNGTYTPASDKIGFSSVTVAFALDDADVEAAQANETKSVRVRSKSGNTYGNYKSMTMSQSTYTPQGQQSAHDCIIVSDGNTTVGRYDIQTYGNNKYTAGHTQGLADAWITYNHNGQGTSHQGEIELDKFVYPGSNSQKTWHTLKPWFGYRTTPGTNPQGTLEAGKYIKLVGLNKDGGVEADNLFGATWYVPTGASYRSLGTGWYCSVTTLGDEKNYTLSKTIPKNQSITGISNGNSYEIFVNS